MTATLDEIKQRLKQSFKDDAIKHAVLDSDWYDKNINSGIHSTGFCYAACEVIYRLTGGKDKWKKFAISKDKWTLGGHCFLVDKETGERLDITSDQYTSQDINIPYDLGKAGGFRTKDFGIKAKKLAKMTGLI